jgi:hypothetical protein
MIGVKSMPSRVYAEKTVVWRLEIAGRFWKPGIMWVQLSPVEIDYPQHSSSYPQIDERGCTRE